MKPSLLALSTMLAASVSPDVARSQGDVASASGAVLRALDKVSGQVTDLEIRVGEERAFGRLSVTVSDCRYPIDNPAGNAFAYVIVRVAGAAAPEFDGWMIASSPALSALDDPRYDVWVRRCTIS